MEDGKNLLYVDDTDLLAWRYCARAWQLQKPPSRATRAGQSRSRQKGRGIEFCNARIYQPGDDVRSIDWRMTARKNKTHTREFQEDKEHQIFVVVDMGSRMRFGSIRCLKSVTAANTAAILGWTALSQGDRIGGFIVGSDRQALRPSRQRRRFSYWLGQLSSASQSLLAEQRSKPPPWPEALEATFRFLKHASMVVVIGDMLALGEDEKDTLRYQATHKDIILIHIFDALERQLPARGSATFSDGARTLRLNLAVAREKHNDLYAEDWQALQSHCQQSGIGLLTISTEDAIVAALYRQKVLVAKRA